MLTILTKPKWHPQLEGLGATFAETPEDLEASDGGGGILISLFTNVIVPKDIIGRFGAAYNIHPGGITNPGRDPHHWAVYDRSDWFGVTLHEMTEQVDAGTVIRTAPFRVEGRPPQALRAEADRRAVEMIRLCAPPLRDGCYAFPPLAEEWHGTRRSRAVLLAMCDMRGLSAEETEHRKFAFQGFENHFRF